MSQRVQLLLSDRILGSTFVPQDGIWNYWVGLGPRFQRTTEYTMTLAGQPIPFRDPSDRPNHFSAFQNIAVEEEAMIESAYPFA
ncbi:hypothetical protein PCANC_10441 [Puccinia coronata f. sp. avenae]|uniref:PROCT domain-containing protein n=1 Tax=Puccinia coronata f. sp. avenae TaxID=200324 RepID=A0A2N5VI88_9BASI|nr:hypothetical protein PCANC_18788 [Puccinia coronata f. sp. avenae]PLW34769.1 hypothetical protein PCASD_12958 [Puccinia coronata f. sp. avenae]PLW49707.1 hypothetical protein PCANC_10441 [Puccinia coronata f. sp. avenae]